MSIWWTIGAFILVLTPIIIVHELGHFVAARLSGIRVDEFGLGFPPRAVKLFKRGDTLYSLNWIPVGGFVRPAGEDDPSVPDGLAAASKKARLFTLSAGAGANFLLALVLLWIAYMIGPPSWPSVWRVIPGSPAENAGLKIEDVILEIDGLPYSTSDQLARKLRSSAGQEVELLILRDGEEMSVVLTPRRPEEYGPGDGPTGISVGPSTWAMISEVTPGSPAAEAGLLSGDLILDIPELDYSSMEEINQNLSAKAGEQVNMLISRDGEEMTIVLTPLASDLQDQEYYDPSGFSLVISDDIRIGQRPLDALFLGANTVNDVIMGTIRAPIMLIRGQITAAEARPVGPVGISQLAGLAAEQSAVNRDLFPLLSFAAIISVALGFTNLLPIPALDGGRIVFVLVEAVRGRRVEPEREGMVHLVGMLVLLALMVLVIIQDIVNPITNF